MWNMLNNFQARVSQFFYSGPVQKEDLTFHRMGQLKVTVDASPLGSYGKDSRAGTVTIHHLDHKSFSEWSGNDLFNLALLERTFLLFNEQAGVSNTLILGRQEDARGEFKVTLVPYQKCGLIEKIKVLMRVFFKSWIKPITKEQAHSTVQFYQSFLNQSPGFEVRSTPQQGKPDAFCRPEVIEGQKIFDFVFYDRTIHLLHDKWPKGSPHFLIVPRAGGGHCDGSNHNEENRFHILSITQQAARVALKEKPDSTLFVIERNGEKLQSVQHKHKHVISANYSLDSLWGRIRTVASLCLAPFRAVSPSHYEHYKQYQWMNLEMREEKKATAETLET